MVYRVGMNIFIESLKQLCHDHLLEEKRLLAHNLRIGHQWLESVARTGQPVVNVHIKTLRGMAMDLAGPEMTQAGVKTLSPLAAIFLMERVWSRCQSQLEGYLGSVRPGARFFGKLHQTLLQLRMAGKTGKKMDPSHFEAVSKGREVAQLLMAYEAELERGGWVDEAGCLQKAIARLRSDPSACTALGLVIFPEDQLWSGLEKQFIETLPTEQRRVLPVDTAPATPPLSFFRAVGEVNEVREVVRQCLQAGLPLDEVEIILSQSDPYIPLWYELAGKIKPDSPEENGSKSASPALPLTFAEGIPARYSRPARALSAWLEWIHNGSYFQSVLVQMLRDGLFESPSEGISYARLADTLRSLPIGHGRERYLSIIEAWIRSLSTPKSALLSEAEEELWPEKQSERLNTRLKTLLALKEMIERLLSVCPEIEASSLEIIQAARLFLEQCARTAGELDAYAKKELLEEIKRAEDLLVDAGEDTSFDAVEWLISLKDNARLMGSGPRPGHIYVSNLASGGHSGRPHTFILGMDDGRFPGGGLQDPLLLDSERKTISMELSTASERLQEKVDGFHRLLARLRGEVTLSYCCRDLLQDRELFAAPTLLALHEQAGKGKAAVPVRMVSFAPAAEECCLSESEWWLMKLSSRPVNTLATATVASCFSHLKRGLLSAAERDSRDFTEYDGCLGVQAELDPTQPGGPVLSANSLQRIGKCPLSYFFRSVLHIRPLEETVLDPDIWLDNLTAGSLLHEVFREFLTDFIGQSRRPSLESDWDTLLTILNRQISHARRNIPPLNEALFARQVKDLQQTARVFLIEESHEKTAGFPLYLEASLGLPAQENPTGLDTPDPVKINLPNGTFFHSCGRIDRIDSSEAGGFQIWDYKTGSSSRYKHHDPYMQGRLVQHILYIELVQRCLSSTVGKKAEIEGFGFFFPGKKARGERITWTPEDLRDGKEVIQSLCQIAASGAFLGSDSKDDCKYCDYLGVCQPIGQTNLRSYIKLKNLDNPSLEPMRKLRNIQND